MPTLPHSSMKSHSKYPLSCVLGIDEPVLAKVELPNDKRERERLGVLLEGKRVTVKGITCHVGNGQETGG